MRWKELLSLGIFSGMSFGLGIGFFQPAYLKDWSDEQVNKRKHVWALLNQDFGSPFSSHLQVLDDITMASYKHKSLTYLQKKDLTRAVNAISKQIHTHLPTAIQEYRAQLRDPTLPRKKATRGPTKGQPLSDDEIRTRLQANIDLLSQYKTVTQLYLNEIQKNIGEPLKQVRLK